MTFHIKYVIVFVITVGRPYSPLYILVTERPFPAFFTLILHTEQHCSLRHETTMNQCNIPAGSMQKCFIVTQFIDYCHIEVKTAFLLKYCIKTWSMTNMDIFFFFNFTSRLGSRKVILKLYKLSLSLNLPTVNGDKCNKNKTRVFLCIHK